MPVTDHARYQAFVRYGVAPTEREWDCAILDIVQTVAGDRRAALLMCRMPDGMERWSVKIGAVDVQAVYKPDMALIVTVIPRGANPRLRHRPYSAQSIEGRATERRERGIDAGL